MKHLRPTFPDMGQDWTATATLPGGEIDEADVPQFIARLQRDYRWLPHDLMRHYARTYGARTERVIHSANSLADLGQQFGPNFYEAEAHYLMEQEWAETAQDILTRRTKHGLHMNAEQTAVFDAWLKGLDTRSAEAGCDRTIDYSRR